MTGDDGIRVLVDGTEVVNGWFYQAPTTYAADVALSGGQHTVIVEYFEHTGGAIARFSESRLADPRPEESVRTPKCSEARRNAPGAKPASAGSGI